MSLAGCWCGGQTRSRALVQVAEDAGPIRADDEHGQGTRARRHAVDRWLTSATTLAVFASAVALWYVQVRLPWTETFLLWGLWWTVAVCAVRADRLPFSTAVFKRELVRHVRRGPLLLTRTVYAAVMAGVLLFFVIMESSQSMAPYWGEVDPAWYGGMGPHLRRVAAYALLAIHLVLVFILTLVVCNASLFGKPQQKFLQMVLLTGLSDLDIVLGALGAGLTMLASFALIAVIGLWGLVPGALPMNVAVAGWEVMAFTSFSAGSLTILAGARGGKSSALRAAMALYVFASTALWIADQFMVFVGWGSTTFSDFVHWVNIGNIITVVIDLVRAGELEVGALQAAREYAWFHGAVALLCIAVAARGLRRWASANQDASAAAVKKAKRVKAWLRFAPLLDPWPVFWKDLRLAAPRRFFWFRYGGIAALLALPVVHCLYWSGTLSPLAKLPEPAFVWVCMVAGVVLGVTSFVVVLVALAGVDRMSTERFAKSTFESLMLTGIDAKSVVFSKLAAACFSPLALAPLVIFVVSLCLACGGFRLSGLPGWGLAFPIYVALAAAIGVWAGTISKSQIGTILLFLLACCVVVGGVGLVAWLVSIACPAVTQPQLIVPPAPLVWLPKKVLTDVAGGERAGSWIDGLYFILGLFFCIGLTVALLRWAVRALRREMEPASTREKSKPESSAPIQRFSANLAGEICEVGNGTLAIFRRIGLPRLSLACGSFFLPLAIILAAYWFSLRSVRQELALALTDTDRQDPGWRWQDLKEPDRKIPDDKNSALQIQKVWPRIENAWERHLLTPTASYASNLLTPNAAYTIEPYSESISADLHEAMRQRLGKLADAVRDARRIVDMPYGRFPADTNGRPMTPADERDFTQPASAVTYLLGWDAYLRAHDGNIDGALENCLAILYTSRALKYEVNAWSQTVRASIPEAAFNQIAATLKSGQGNPAMLERLARDLDVEPSLPASLAEFRAHRAREDYQLVLLSENKLPSEMILSADGRYRKRQQDFSLGHPSYIAMRTIPNSLNGFRAAQLRFYNNAIEAVKIPMYLPQRFWRLKEIENQGRSLVAGFRFQWANVQWDPVHAANLAAMGALLAVERYRMRYGRWPASLGEISPEFVAEVPKDPFDGQPLRYRRLRDGVVVYSVGSNLTDDGGDLTIPSGARDPRDIGFRLWDVERRGKNVK
jgi:hypothetical protein